FIGYARHRELHSFPTRRSSDLMLDADGSADPAEIESFVDALCDGADFAKGSRFIDGGGSSDITVTRKAGNWFFSALVNLLYGTRDRKSTRLNSSHVSISYAVFC